MPKKVTHADAQLILQLYDLRREAEMRKARNWVATQFWPQSADDYIKVASAVGNPENAWLRQVTSYWDMCARRTSSSIRGSGYRRSHGCRHQAPSSLASVGCPPSAHPAPDAGCDRDGTRKKSL